MLILNSIKTLRNDPFFLSFFFIPVLGHEHIFFEDGLDPANLGFFEDGQVRSDDPNELGNYDNAHLHGFNDCLLRQAAKNVGLGNYCLFSFSENQYNCQDWAEAVCKEYINLGGKVSK